jgi:hypothetical protein
VNNKKATRKTRRFSINWKSCWILAAQGATRRF